MTTEVITIRRFDAGEGKLFDWSDLSAHTHEDEDGNKVIDHLYAKTIYLSNSDDIINYIEIDAPEGE